ncbi:extracellular solute-binding protein [Pseudolysinimonas sp.]
MKNMRGTTRVVVPVLGGLMAVALAGCAAGGDSGANEITFQSWRLADPGAIGQLHNGWVADFNASQDEIAVVGEEVPFDKKGDILLNQILAGSPPDVVAVATADVPQYAEYMLSLDDYYAAEGPEFEERFIPGARDLVSWDGSYYGVPMEMGPVDGLYYNTEILERAGVDPEEAVRSWDAFSAALAAIDALGGDVNPLVMAGKDPSRIDYFWAWYYGAEAQLGSEDELRQNMCSPNGVETFAYLTENFTERGYGPSPVDIGFEEYLNTFAAGNTGFAQGGAWMYNLFVDASPDLEGKIGVTSLPPREEGGRSGMVLDAVALMIPKGSSDPDAAWEYIKYLTADEKQLQNALEAGFLPTVTAVADDPALAEQDRLAFYAQVAAENGFPRPRTAALAEVKQLVWEQWQSALLGQVSPEQAAKAACAAVDSALG